MYMVVQAGTNESACGSSYCGYVGRNCCIAAALSRDVESRAKKVRLEQKRKRIGILCVRE